MTHWLPRAHMHKPECAAISVFLSFPRAYKGLIFNKLQRQNLLNTSFIYLFIFSFKLLLNLLGILWLYRWFGFQAMLWSCFKTHYWHLLVKNHLRCHSLSPPPQICRTECAGKFSLLCQILFVCLHIAQDTAILTQHCILSLNDIDNMTSL